MAWIAGQMSRSRQNLEALELTALLVDGTDPSTFGRLARHRELPVADDVGAKMLAAVAAQEWRRRRPHRDV